MPTPVLPTSIRLSTTRIPSPATLLLGLAFTMPMAANADPLDSLSYFRYTQPVRMELLLPIDGPGSALLNPARVAEARRFHAQYGTRKAGDSRAIDLSLGTGWRGQYFVGASFSGANGSFDFARSTVLDNRIGLQAAYRHPLDPEGEGHVSIGVAETFHYVNGMSTFKYNRSTPDFGILFVPTRQPGGWRLEFGMAARDLRPLKGKVHGYRSQNGMEFDSANVDFAPWIGTGSVIVASPARRWSLFGSAALGAEYEPAYWDEPLPGWDIGPTRGYLPRLGLRYRPIQSASFSAERVWSSFWVLDATLGTGTWLPIRCDANFRLAYGPSLQYQHPDRTGWSLGWNLAIGM